MALLLLLPAGCAKPAETGETDPLRQADAQQQLARNGNLHYQNQIIAIGDQIAFTDTQGRICLANANGRQVRLVDEQGGLYFSCDDSWLFYADDQEQGYLHKINLDGTNAVRVGQKSLTYIIAADKQIFAIEAATGAVIGMDQDGTDRRVLSEKTAATLSYAGGMLYITEAGADGGLLRCQPETGETTSLLQHQITSLNIVGDWFYFADPADQYRLHVWSEKNNAEVCLSQSGFIKPFIIREQDLFYVDPQDQNRLYRLPVQADQAVDSRKAVLIIDDVVDVFVLIGDFIYYRRPDSRRIYRVPTAGGIPFRIA